MKVFQPGHSKFGGSTSEMDRVMSALPPKADVALSHLSGRFGPTALCLLKCDYRLVVTNNPREASACVNCRIALSVVAKFSAFSRFRRSAFSAGSLSLITHRHTNILAS